MSTLRTFNLQNPDSGTVNIEMDQGGNTLMTGIATVRGAAHFTSTSGSDAVGIGTDITAYKLDVRVTGAETGLRVYNPDTSSNASGIIRLGNDDNQNAAFLRLNGSNNTSAVGGAGSLVLGHGLSKDLHLSTAGVSRLRITSGGQLNLAGNMQFTAATPELEFNNGGPRFRVPAANTLTIHTGGGLGTTSNERLRITSDGKVGINETSPTALLDINHPNTEQGLKVRSRYGNIATAMVKFDSDPQSDGGDGNVLHLHGGSSRTDSEILHIDSTGAGDIFDIRGDGLTRIYKQLQLEHSSNVAKIIFNEYGANDIKAQIEMDQLNGSSGQLIFRTQDSGTLSERLRITSSGAVNLSSPSNTVAAGLLNVPNGSRLSSGVTPRGTYVTGNGGIVDMARYEMINKCITAFPANNTAICAINGAPLYINDTRDTWDRYYALPNYLLGTLTHDCINNSSFNITLACTMTVFMGRSSTWNGVNTSGWNLIESNTSIGPFSATTRLYVKTLAAGTHSLDNDSAMYFFSL